MADEQLPKPDGIVPGTPPAKPVPYSQDVIYAGVPPPTVRSEAIVAGTPAAVVPPAPPPPDPADKTAKIGGAHRSQLDLFFSWLAGVFIILVCGWGLIGVFCYLDRKFHLNLSWEIASVIGGIGSLVLLFLLERNLWLSRFMGLRLGPHSSQVTETLYFFFFGIVGLLLRTTEAPAATASKPHHHETDGTREIVETVVFVVVLVLLLKTFLVEAFVIPTGSMADTLLGYHKDFTCEKCGYRFVVNCSKEAEPDSPRERETIIGGYCPSCDYPNVAIREKQ